MVKLDKVMKSLLPEDLTRKQIAQISADQKRVTFYYLTQERNAPHVY